MANILYVTRSNFINFKRAGGMGTKSAALQQAWDDGGINRVTMSDSLKILEKTQRQVHLPDGVKPRMHSVSFDVVILELLAINDESALNANVEILKDFKGAVLVYGSDSELLRWKGQSIEMLKSGVDGWIANCEWQANYFRDFGVPVLGVVREPINCDLFRPGEVRKRVICAGGRISYGKQSDFFIDLFTALKETDYATAYVGSSQGWGQTDPLGLELEDQLKAVTDTFYGEIPQSQVASVFGESAILVLNSHYDTCSRMGMEGQASGLCIVAGPHLCFDEYPHAHRFSNLTACLSVLSEVTESFTMLPVRKDSDSNRKWALEEYSYESSLHQINDVLRRIL